MLVYLIKQLCLQLRKHWPNSSGNCYLLPVQNESHEFSLVLNDLPYNIRYQQKKYIYFLGFISLKCKSNSANNNVAYIVFNWFVVIWLLSIVLSNKSLIHISLEYLKMRMTLFVMFIFIMLGVLGQQTAHNEVPSCRASCWKNCTCDGWRDPARVTKYGIEYRGWWCFTRFKLSH
jgi:hypothetical protein